MNTNKIRVYLSAGWFDEFQDKALTYIENVLFNNEKFEVFSPRKEIVLTKEANKEQQKNVFQQNIEEIKKADLIISSTVGKDMGTLFENGVAYQLGKPIIYTFFDERFKDVKFNVMLSQSGIACFTNKKEFEEFINKIDKDNLQTIKQDYEGNVE